MRTRQEGRPAHFKLCCGRIADADCSCPVIMPLQVAEVLGLGAESPGQDLCETRHGALQPQRLRELIQRQLAPYCDCLWNRPGQIVVPMRYGHILQACTKRGQTNASQHH